LSDNIERVPLRKIGKIVKREVPIEPTEMYQTVGCKLYGLGVYGREIKKGHEIAAKKMYRIRENDLLINRIWAQKGSAGIVPKHLDGAVVTNDFPVVEFDLTKVFPPYIAWYVKYQDFWDECRSHSHGTSGRERLKPKELPNITFPHPPLNEQQRVAAILDRLMERIDEARRQREAAMEAIKVFKKTSAQEYLNKKDYPHKSIATLCDIISGGTPSKSNPDYWDGSIPWVRPKNMKNKEILDSDAHITENALKETNIKLLEPDTVLIVVRGMIMVHTVPSAVLKNRAVINQDMKGLVVNDSLLPEYLCACLWIYNDKLLSLVEKSGHGTRRLPTESLLNFTIPVPTLFEQRQLLANLSALNGKIKEIQHLQITSKNDLEDLIPSLLQKAFAGEL